MKINVYTSLNGVGLEKDANLLKNMLSEHEIFILDWQKHQRGGRADIQIHLQIPRYDCIQLSNRNIFVPNPEWFYPNWTEGLPRFKEIWCKTRDCFSIFGRLHPSCVFTGFISQDFYSPEVKKEKKILHVCGSSRTKGTLEIIEAYKKNKDLPKCFFVGANKWDVSGCNIKQLGRLSEPDLKRLMNESLIHLCPSYYEGWGHYLHEAASTGAVVITTDAPPMSEFFSSRLVLTETEERMNKGTLYKVDVESLVQEIKKVYSVPLEQLILEGNKNRESFLQRNKACSMAILTGI